MSFDKDTRNALSRLVSECRRVLRGDIAEQLQGKYGLQPDGRALPLSALGHLTADEIVFAAELRSWEDHLAAGAPAPTVQGARRTAFEQMTHEAAFTILNRLAAIRMAEARGLIVESVQKGLSSDGFRLFEQLALGSLGDRDEAYSLYLGLLFDELGTELGPLFERRTPGGRLFPRPPALREVLGLLDAEEMAALWTQDETIGWIYQYFNSKEERDAMRKASAAPRTSRELAVRNQFFTPRYVVEFLTDNTLGRIWYEMCGGATRLTEECQYLMRRPQEIFLGAGDFEPARPEPPADASAADLLAEPVYIGHRPKKDPRDLAVLDPAAGSGHFLLYAFDLLETIYEEAWADPSQPRWQMSGKTLAEEYPDLEQLRREIPGLILRNNLHGIDIDARTQQIAVLALWLRAQRSFQRLGIPSGDRPRIRRMNVVTAEPMPGERELLAEFVASLRPVVLADLVRLVWDKMRLAGEAGSLLRIDDELRAGIAAAHRQWLSGPRTEQLALFREGGGQSYQTELFDVSGISDAEFWNEAEERVLDALRRFAEAAGTTRRLFVDDAIEGFAFIELTNRKFDVVLMNPPFGLMPRAAYEYAVTAYPLSYSDMALAFMDRGLAALMPSGRVGAITSRAFMSVSDAERFRSVIALKEIDILVDLGTGVMDGALVDASAQVLAARVTPISLFLDCREVETKDEAARRWAQERGGGEKAYPVVLKRFAGVAGTRIAYDQSADLEVLLAAAGKGIDPTLAIARIGGNTFEDERFLRLRWEVDHRAIGERNTWVLVGRNVPEFSPYYYPHDVVMKWARGGRELQARNEQVNGQTAQARQGSTNYFKAGVVFGRRSSPTIAFRIQPAGCSFSSTVGFILPHEQEDRLFLLGYLNSSYVRGLLATLTTRQSYTVGHIRALQPPDSRLRKQISALALRCLTAKRLMFRRVETDPQFAPIPLTGARTLQDLLTAERARLRSLVSEAVQAAAAIDRLMGADRSDLSNGIHGARPEDIGRAGRFTQIDAGSLAFALLSFAIGVAFGRWDVRLAISGFDEPPLPPPFDALPPLQPAALEVEGGYPARLDSSPPLSGPPSSQGYPVRVSWDGILVDDPGIDSNPHPDDIVSRVREVFGVLWPSTDGSAAQTIEAEACSFLGVRSLQDYLRRPSGFFSRHLAQYSTSRRQAPIYWPLSTASGSYTVWLYYARLSDDLLYRVVTKYLEPKLAEVDRHIAELQTESQRNSGRNSGRLGDRIDELRTLRAELDEMRAELLRVAALPYRPNLDDGALVSAAPLHGLFRLPAWRRDLKACWDKLEAGHYDWAHLARIMWPDRVRESSRRDRSIAIAQGLESAYEGPGPGPRGQSVAVAVGFDDKDETE